MTAAICDLRRLHATKHFFERHGQRIDARLPTTKEVIALIEHARLYPDHALGIGHYRALVVHAGEHFEAAVHVDRAGVTVKTLFNPGHARVRELRERRALTAREAVALAAMAPARQARPRPRVVADCEMCGMRAHVAPIQLGRAKLLACPTCAQRHGGE